MNPYHQKIAREVEKICRDKSVKDWEALVEALTQYVIDESRRSFLNGLKGRDKRPRHAKTE
jgi:hypothetical protein